MSRKPVRLYVDELFVQGQEWILLAPQAHYLKHVLRKNTGESFHVFNGRQGEWEAQLIESSSKREEKALFQREIRGQSEERLRDVWLCFAPLKPTPLGFLIEKATELGVRKFCPVLTQQTVVRSINPERLRVIAREAAEQCERLSVPSFDPLKDLKSFLEAWPQDRKLFVCDERRKTAPLCEKMGTLGLTPAGLWIGPEGGFSEQEFKLLGASPKVEFVSLGPLVLRAETAALSALALFHSSPF